MDLVAPIIPNAQENKGPELFLQSMHSGLAAAAQFAQQRRQSEDEMLKLATTERIAQDEHAFQREKLYKDSEVQDSLMRSHAQYYKAMGDAAIIKADAYAKGTTNIVAFNQQREALVNEVNDHAESLRLNDPVFEAKEPVKFAANVMQFKDAWKMSTMPEVMKAVQNYQARADQQKIPIKEGATFDQEKGIWTGGSERHVPLWEVVRNLQDPTKQEATMDALQASGHMKVIEDFETIAGKKVPRTRSEPTQQLKSALEEGKGVQFQHVPSRVPPAMLRKGDAKGTGGPTELPLPEPDLPPVDMQSQPQADAQSLFNPTQTDLYIKQAKDAIAKGAPRDAVAARLQQDFGIDPGVLWTS